MPDSDLETQPLLQTASTEEVYIPPQNNQNNQKARKRWFSIGLMAGLAIITFMISLTSYISKVIPTDEALQSNIAQISNLEVVNVHLDGWRRVDGSLSNESGKALQFTTKARFFLDYDKLSESDIELDERQRKWFKFTSQRLLKTMCFQVRNLTTFNQVENRDVSIASVYIMEPFCVDLRNGTVTDLELTLLVEPRMKNLIGVLKKLWNHDYKGLNLWSNLDISVYKLIHPFINLNLKLGSIDNLRVNWKDFIDWDETYELITTIEKQIQDIEIDEINMKDVDDGFGVAICTKEIDLSYFSKLFEWLHLPVDGFIPSIHWNLRLGDCFGRFTIPLPTLSSNSEQFQVGEKIKPVFYNHITGPLPDSLLKQVCWADEENTRTPLTLLLNNLFSESDKVKVQIKGSIEEESLTNHELENIIIPVDMLNTALNEVSYFTIENKMTFNTSKLIKEFFIADMSLRWVDQKSGGSRLSLVGTIVGLFDLSFYKTDENRIAINHIKGDLQLYHNHKHFISLPMKVWIDSKSKVIHEDGNTVMAVKFDINDDELEILDRLEVTKCFNEILFKGETQVSFDAVIDIVIKSLLGDITLNGLKTTGETVVH